MKDLIERQAAIDAVEFGITFAKVIDKSTGEAKELFREGNRSLTEAIKRIKRLPSAPVGDTVSRQTVLNLLSTMPQEEAITRAMLVQSVKQMSTAQPERKRGKWIDDGDPFMWECGCCGYRVKRYNNTRYCPNCGADMREDEQE